jgi:hypothetical protein
MTSVFFSCGQERKPTPATDKKDLEIPEALKNVDSQKRIIISDYKNIDTKFDYIDSNGNLLTIENSLPRGGLKYTDFLGKEYVYAVFWTQITNETDSAFYFAIDFPENSYELPSSPDRHFKLLIPPDTMTLDKEPLFNYGLDLKFYLDNNLHKPSSLKRTIKPKSSNGFYVVTLFNKGVDGTLRTGLSIKEQNLFYKINDKEIYCGKINLKKLTLQK